jgi:hypothetical protein
MGRLAGVAAVPAGLFRQEPTNRHDPSRNRPTGPRLPPKSSPLLLRGPFHHAAREPEFRQQMDRFHKGMVATARRELARVIGDRAWAQWARPACPGGRHRGGDGLAGCRPTRPRPGRRPDPPGPGRRHHRRPVTQSRPGHPEGGRPVRGLVECGSAGRLGPPASVRVWCGASGSSRPEVLVWVAMRSATGAGRRRRRSGRGR